MKPILLEIPCGATPDGSPENWKRSMGIDRVEGFKKRFDWCRDQMQHDIQGLSFHLPFGRQGPWPMDYDSAVRLDEFIAEGIMPAGSLHTAEEYAKHCGEFLTDFPDATIATYVGQINSTAAMVTRKNDPAAWVSRAMSSIRSIFQIHEGWGIEWQRIPIYLDGACGIQLGSIEFNFLEMLQAFGVHVGSEPHPKDDNRPHLNDSQMHMASFYAYATDQTVGNSYRWGSMPELPWFHVAASRPVSLDQYRAWYSDHPYMSQHIDSIGIHYTQLSMIADIRA